MDSPEAAKSTAADAAVAASTSTAALSDSPPVQESPFSNYVCTLSPIKPVQGSHLAQGFVGLSSPPLVFTSPRILPHRETSFLQRCQLSHTSTVGTSKNDDGSKKCADAQVVSEKPVTHLGSSLIIDTEKDKNYKISVQDQPGSSSGCVDEYFSDPVEVDCANSMNLDNLHFKQSNDVVQSSENSTNKDKITVKLENENDMTAKVDVPLDLFEQGEEDPQGQSSLKLNHVRNEEEKNSDGWPSNEVLDLVSGMPVDHASNECDNLVAKVVQKNEDSTENVGPNLHEPIQNIVHPDPEAIQLQRGMSRRCLQFEEAQKTTVNSNNYPNITNNTTGVKSAIFTTDLESLNASHSEEKVVNLTLPMTTMFPPHYGVKSPIAVSKPSGIGLHLNTIINNMPVAHSATATLKSAPMISCPIMGDRNSSIQLSSSVEKVAAEDIMLEMKASLVTSSTASDSLLDMESMEKPMEHLLTPHNKRNFNSEHADNIEELNQLSPKKKKKKLLSTDGDGCKRCNCKKTKCLKLYCDCFAAGIYCAEPCACQGCFNRPEYVETVLETRQQIESRNPLAFAPKVVQNVAEYPALDGEDGNRFTPSSARHKRGCNCKRSMCLKKYCECYQANVGCSTGCRCEGCKNVYGRKEDYIPTEGKNSNRTSDERLEGTVDGKLEMVETKKDFLCADDSYDLQNLTPLTPSFHSSGHGKDAPSQLAYGRFLRSPESDISTLPSCSKTIRSPRNSNSMAMLPGRTKETLDLGSYDQGAEYNVADMMDQFSPRCDAFDEICDLTPLPNTSLMTFASSASSKTREWSNVSRMQLCPRSGRPSSGSSLRWRSSPITPMTRLGETKNQGLESESGGVHILGDNTPEILKEASTPTVSVKVSSPNKKRVSPPHILGNVPRPSSSGGGLKSGRKFILKAVPSFPPLTPCIDSKSRTNEKES